MTRRCSMIFLVFASSFLLRMLVCLSIPCEKPLWMQVYFFTERLQCSEIMCNESRDKSRPPAAPDRGKCSPRGCACQCNSQHKEHSNRLSQASWWHVLARAALIAVSASLFPVMCAFPTPLITPWLLSRAVLHYNHSLDELFEKIFQVWVQCVCGVCSEK